MMQRHWRTLANSSGDEHSCGEVKGEGPVLPKIKCLPEQGK